jgi:hypothetical protein
MLCKECGRQVIGDEGVDFLAVYDNANGDGKPTHYLCILCFEVGE